MNLPALKNPKVFFSGFSFRSRGQHVKVIIFSFLLVFAIAASYYTTKNQISLSDFFSKKQKPTDAPLVDDKGNATENFYNTIPEKSYEELREAAPEIVTNPNIALESMREQADEAIDNPNPVNNYLIFDGKTLANAVYVAKQGDYVTWRNTGDLPIEIVGKNWSSFEEIQPGVAFTQKFDYIGIYDYEVLINKKSISTGKVEINKVTE